MIRSIAVAFLLLVLGAGVAAGQTAEGAAVRVTTQQEDLLAAPGGTRIARLGAGTVLRQSVERDGWSEVTLEAFVPSNRVRSVTRGEYTFDLASGGSDLHAAPSGETVGRGEGGMLIERIGEEDGWSRIRRTAWIRSAAVEPHEPAPAAEPAASEETADESAPEPAGEEVPSRIVILDRPGGDTLAVVYRPGGAYVTDRAGRWSRLQVEGWTTDDVSRARGMANRLSAAEIRAEPERYVGRTVQWSLQYLDLRRADGSRTGVSPGEWYVLARSPDGEAGMIYLVVDADQRGVLRDFVPLQRFTARGTVRMGRAPETGHPVIEAEEVRP